MTYRSTGFYDVYALFTRQAVIPQREEAWSKKTGERNGGRKGLNRKLQSLEGQQDVPYLDASTNQRPWLRQCHHWRWRRMDRDRDKMGWKVMNVMKKRAARKEGARTCYIISSFSCLCCPHNEIGLLWTLRPICSIHSFVRNIPYPPYHWWRKSLRDIILIWRLM